MTQRIKLWAMRISVAAIVLLALVASETVPTTTSTGQPSTGSLSAVGTAPNPPIPPAVADDTGNAGDSCSESSDCVTGVCEDIPFAWNKKDCNKKFLKRCGKGAEGATCNDVDGNCKSGCCVDGKCVGARVKGWGVSCAKACQCYHKYPSCRARKNGMGEDIR